MLVVHCVLLVEYLWVPESFLCSPRAEVGVFTLMRVFSGSCLPLSLFSSGLGSISENSWEFVQFPSLLSSIMVGKEAAVGLEARPCSDRIFHFFLQQPHCEVSDLSFYSFFYFVAAGEFSEVLVFSFCGDHLKEQTDEMI